MTFPQQQKSLQRVVTILTWQRSNIVWILGCMFEHIWKCLSDHLCVDFGPLDWNFTDEVYFSDILMGMVRWCLILTLDLIHTPTKSHLCSKTIPSVLLWKVI